MKTKSKIGKIITKAQFKKMTSAQKRVVLAQDVIQQIKANKLIPHTGDYLWVLGATDADYSKEADEVFKKRKCEVCALGAAFVAGVIRCDDLKLDYHNRDEMIDYLKKYFDFSDDQLTKIEDYFEGFNYRKTFVDKYYDEDLRLIAIMKNIIKNKGTLILFPRK